MRRVCVYFSGKTGPCKPFPCRRIFALDTEETVVVDLKSEKKGEI